MSDLILFDEADAVVTITLNRPDQLNAFGDDMRERLVAALDRAAASATARVLVITGAGRGFCAGGDVRHMAALKERGAGFDALEPLLDLGRAIVTRIDALALPTIAAVNGVAAGAGLNLALACDLRFASERASFGATFARIGLHPDWGGTWFLPRRVGLAKALELAWLGDMIDAAEALRIGLADRVIADAEFSGHVRDVAGRLARAPQASVRLAKRNLRRSLHRTLDRSLVAESEAQAACWASPDSAEGFAAFVAKRPPVFSGASPRPEAPSPAARRFE